MYGDEGLILNQKIKIPRKNKNLNPKEDDISKILSLGIWIFFGFWIW